ncbi:MAG: hypothetical protein EBU75_07095 [Betaproteobacteria bacterium]|nr:hypothetical protein [Betaproteobacteria bacterium]
MWRGHRERLAGVAGWGCEPVTGVRQRPLEIGSRVRIHIHANDVSLSTHQPEGTSIQNIFSGVIEAIDGDSHAASCLVTIRLKSQTLLARITYKAAANLELAVGQPVWAQVKSVALAEH